jgi:hypothetical protein
MRRSTVLLLSRFRSAPFYIECTINFFYKTSYLSDLTLLLAMSDTDR